MRQPASSGSGACQTLAADRPTTGEEQMKVLVATDGSEAALDAAHRAVDLLRAGAEIALVTVIPGYEDPMESAGGIEGPDATEEEAEQDYQDNVTHGRDALERTSAALGADADV